MTENIFEITPDLNIEQIKDLGTNEAKTVIADPPSQKIETVNVMPPSPKIETVSVIPQSSSEVLKPVIQTQETVLVSTGDKTPEVTPKEVFVQKAIRTYEGDVADFMSHGKSSVASIAIAESNRREKEKDTVDSQKNNERDSDEKKHNFKKLSLLLISLLFISGGIVGAYYLYTKSPLAKETIIAPLQNKTNSLVLSDSFVTITVDGLLPNDIITKINNEVSKQQAVNSIKEIIFVQKTNNITGDENVLTRIRGQKMLEIMDILVPDILARTITDEWMMGIYSSQFGNKDVFIVATTDYFQNAFAGMLSWEGMMADDLKLYLPQSIQESIAPPINNVVSTSTATTTATTTIESTPPIINKYFTIKGRFFDAIVKNKDVRELRTENGDIIFLYSFVDSKKLVIASKESTLEEIIKRLEQQAFLR
ncbi:MAG: hypothetical protein WCW03_01570 [Candidatus Paceibacterota bacterium]|jgi:hypothetical protein